MTTLEPQHLDRLERLIVLLASPHEGEVAAAARALVRTLRRVDLDLYDLARFVRVVAARHHGVDRNRLDHERDHPRSERRALTPIELAQLKRLAGEWRRFLMPHEREAVAGFGADFYQYSGLTEPQIETLAEIHAQVARRAVVGVE